MDTSQIGEIREVDLVQTEVNPDDQGTLYVSLEIDGEDIVRVYHDFPVALYEEWMDSDFDIDLYLSEIEPVYPCIEESDEDEG